MRSIIGLHGEAGVGKDLFADFAESWLKVTFGGTKKFYRTSFAEPVYELAAVIFGVTPEFLGERRGKELNQWFTVTQEQLERARDLWNSWGLDTFIDFSDIWPKFEEEHVLNESIIPCVSIKHSFYPENTILSVYVSPRWILQRVGTEIGRKMVYENVWIDLLRSRIAKHNADMTIVTDIRFDNEAKVIHDMPNMVQSVNLHIVSPTSPHRIKSGHISEDGVSNWLLDRLFINSFTGLESFCADVNFFLEEELHYFINIEETK